jgi:Domain of Unknown Function (DUF1080)
LSVPGDRLSCFSDCGFTMLTVMRLLLVSAALVSLPAVGVTQRVSFEDCVPGNLPPGWTTAITHQGASPRWEAARDETAPSPPCVLAQVSKDGTAGRFPLAIWDAASIRDGEVSVAFRPVSGKVDQAAGILWRYQDPGNYYIVRANALENNVVLYKVVNGVRESIAPKGLPSRAYGAKHAIPSGVWSKLRVTFKGATFTVFLNGERLFEIEDRTFNGTGKTGLWTKADSVTYFDDFEVHGN